MWWFLVLLLVCSCHGHAHPPTPLLFGAIKFYRPTDAYKFGACHSGSLRIFMCHAVPRRLAMCRIRNMLNTSPCRPDLKPEAHAEADAEAESEAESESESEFEAATESESGIRACLDALKTLSCAFCTNQIQSTTTIRARMTVGVYVCMCVCVYK